MNSCTMPIKERKRPADVASNAVRVMQIATGQITDAPPFEKGKNQAAAALGKLGGMARAGQRERRGPGE